MQYSLVTLAERPELVSQLLTLDSESWPPYMLNSSADVRYWERLLRSFPQYQLALLDPLGQIVAEANTIPLAWNGMGEDLPAGWDAALEQGMAESEHQPIPTALVALDVVIKPALRGQALSRRLVEATRQLAVTHGLTHLIIPVRPSFKCLYPLISLEDYAFWTREDGLPFDPWIRTYTRLGARIVKVAQQSTIITGTIAQWEEWTQMRLPQSGSYIIPGALVPLSISSQDNEGRYVEPNVWMQFPVPEPSYQHGVRAQEQQETEDQQEAP